MYEHQNPSCKKIAGEYSNLSMAEKFFFGGGGGRRLLKSQSGRLALQCCNNWIGACLCYIWLEMKLGLLDYVCSLWKLNDLDHGRCRYVYKQHTALIKLHWLIART